MKALVVLLVISVYPGGEQHITKHPMPDWMTCQESVKNAKLAAPQFGEAGRTILVVCAQDEEGTGG